MKIVISGLGLMGSSLALAIKNKHPETEIWGYDFPSIISQALEKKIIDKAVKNWPGACAETDIVFLATPIKIIEKQLVELNKIIDKNTIVTDLGSTKQNVHRIVDALNFSGTFIGGHPMTGSEKSGLEAANPLLYENAVYILTGINSENQEFADNKLISLLEDIKARVLLLTPEAHDEIMAMISHLPQLIAINLVNMVGKRNNPDKPYLDLAAGGFRDLTRIASSNFSIWKDILERNRENIKKALQELIELLEKQSQNIGDLSEDFHSANYYRQQIPKASKGFLHPLIDVLVYVQDEPGTIARMSNALAEQGINIRDIELLKVREKEGGVFRISFADLEEAKQAITILNNNNFRAFLRE
ncbi:MAG: prephenate dehydrogenase [Caldisericaceae bacterium]|nr:prephenate dehydrogenase [Caldisericaceae bacterium]